MQWLLVSGRDYPEWRWDFGTTIKKRAGCIWFLLFCADLLSLFMNFYWFVVVFSFHLIFPDAANDFASVCKSCYKKKAASPPVVLSDSSHQTFQIQTVWRHIYMQLKCRAFTFVRLKMSLLHGALPSCSSIMPPPLFGTDLIYHSCHLPNERSFFLFSQWE